MSTKLIVLSLAFAAVWLLVPVHLGTAAQDPMAGAASAASNYARELKYLDLDGDQRVDARELATGQQMAMLLLRLSWDACDRDRDGGISRQEFEPAAVTAMQALLEEQSATNTEAERQAEEALAGAVPIRVVLERLSADERYSVEVAALREAVEDLDDDDAVVTYVRGHVDRYPRLAPLVHTWVRYYPVHPELRRYAKPGPHWHHLPPAGVKPHKPADHGPKAGQPAPKKGLHEVGKPPVNHGRAGGPAHPRRR